MELSRQEGDIPIPLNTRSAYDVVGSHGSQGHMIHNHHHRHHHAPPPPQPPQNCIITTSSNNNGSSTSIDHEIQNQASKKVVRYKECLKNHAASMGGNATDGCGEFIPNGSEGTLESLTCSACNCHRNFHRKEIEGEPPGPPYTFHRPTKFIPPANTTALYLPPPEHPHPHPQPLIGYPTRGPVPYNIRSSDEDNVGINSGVLIARPHSQVRKRYRTKFTQEQKEKMFQFAEKVGWKLQRQEESVIQEFCQEIGVKRRVLKIWMHNNKHHLAKKSLISTN